jgi:hypothetical protein
MISANNSSPIIPFKLLALDMLALVPLLTLLGNLQKGEYIDLKKTL